MKARKKHIVFDSRNMGSFRHFLQPIRPLSVPVEKVGIGNVHHLRNYENLY